VNEIGFDLLSNEYVFACNLVGKHKDFHRLKASFYGATTPPQTLHESFYERILLYGVYSPSGGVPMRPDNAEAMIADIFSQTAAFYSDPDEVTRRPHHYFSVLEKACPDPDTVWFLNAHGYRFFQAQKLFRNRHVFYVTRAGATTTPVFDIAAPMSFVDGGLPFAIVTAIYMGFKEIVLCGCGYTYQPRQEFHFYDSPVLSTDFSESEAFRWSSKLAEARGVQLRSVLRAPDGYRPMFIRDHPTDQIHRIIDGWARARGVTILNLVPDGFESPVYAPIRRQALQDLLRGPECVRLPAQLPV
jgi:hypothetical protein